MPNTNPYYPKIDDITRIEDLPDILGFLKDGIQELFSDVFYKNFQFSKSVNGDIAFYSLDIVSAKKLSIELPGTGIFLVLNPDYQDYNISAFPITVSSDWKILRYKRFFNVNNFSFSVEDYFYLLVDVLGISEYDVVDFALRRFVVPGNSSTSRIEQLVEDLNIFYNISIGVPTDSETEIEEVILGLHQQASVTAYEASSYAKFTYRPLVTDNIMDYNDGSPIASYRTSTNKYQWDITEKSRIITLEQ